MKNRCLLLFVFLTCVLPFTAFAQENEDDADSVADLIAEYYQGRVYIGEIPAEQVIDDYTRVIELNHDDATAYYNRETPTTFWVFINKHSPTTAEPLNLTLHTLMLTLIGELSTAV